MTLSRLPLVMMVLWLIYSPKLGFGGLAGASLRIDDFLILFYSAITGGIALLGRKRAALPAYAWAFIAYTLFTLASAVINGHRGKIDMGTGIIFAVRGLEYFALFIVGYNCFRKTISIPRIFGFYIIYAAIISLLQYTGVLGSLNSFDVDRLSANTNGPYELAAVLSACLLVTTSERLNRVLPAVAFLNILGTASRITALALSIIWAKSIKLKRSWLQIAAIVLAFAAGSTLVSLVLPTELPAGQHEQVRGSTLSNRISSLTDISIFEQAFAIAETLPVPENSYEYVDSYFSLALESANNIEGDASAFVRILRWVGLWRAVTSDTLSIFIGVGPSFGTTAVDGFYVRVFVESGLIGLALFVIYIFMLLHASSQYRYGVRGVVVVLAVSAIAIDIFVAFKPMVTMWLLLGYADAEFQSRRVSQ
ncbi:MAG: hypothetical protein NVS9B10_05220 [Nevskia sp.]